MKNLQYLKLFESFESKTLTKVFNYVNKSQRGQFKSILEEFCNKTNFPMSKLSDDLFQYLPYNKALSLAANMEDEPCDAESDTIPGEKCSGPTGDELQGIKRGLMEMVDVIFINKVHEENLKEARMHRSELIHALQFQHPKEKDWKKKKS